VAEKAAVREYVEGWRYLAALHRAEVGLVQSVHRVLSAVTHPMPAIATEKAIGWIEGKLGIRLALGQQEATCQATQQKVLVIRGEPGVGRTTLVRSILAIFQA
jgi:exodeoxyribonuclease V alpha subunit